MKDDVTFPFDVVDMFEEGYSLIKAWRTYKKMTQTEVAQKMGITQGAFAQIENNKSNQKETLFRVAKALELDIEHLTLED